MFHHQQGQKSDKSNKALQKQQQTTNTTAPQVNETHPATLIQRAKLNPNSLNTDDVLRLQQTIGNRAATQLIAGKSGQRVQPKLTIGEPGDKYEQEADRVAAEVVNQINAPVFQQAGQGQPIQREEVSEEEKELQMKPMLQLRSGKVGMTAAPEVEASIQQARSGGQPLANNIRKPMERAFGTDFSGVKVHTDTHADQLNQSIQARAFTTGQDVFFRQGEYNPGSRGGQELIAHELTHVVQQNGGAVQRMRLLPTKVQQNPAPDKSSALVQKKAIKMDAEELTDGMKTRFNEAYTQFNNHILSASPLATGDQNQVVVYGVSKKSHSMEHYADTIIYIGNNGYQGDDYRNFTNIWDWSLENPIPKTVAVRIVITINLTINRTIEELYATLLHEWYAHAVKWEETIKHIRQDHGKFALARIEGDGSERRETEEHIQFANWTDEEIDAKVDSLGLNGQQKTVVVNKMKQDRNRHNKETGKVT